MTFGNGSRIFIPRNRRRRAGCHDGEAARPAKKGPASGSASMAKRSAEMPGTGTNLAGGGGELGGGTRTWREGAGV